MSRLFFWSLTSALAGFLFGFDTVVISGAEKTIQDLWNLTPLAHGVAVSAALWGTVLGAVCGAWPTDRFGRRNTLAGIGVLYFVSAVWSGLATDVVTLSLARFIGGVGVGVATVASPLYISEISPPGRRGRLAGLFQFNIVLGILCAFLSNYLIGRSAGEHAWRWMLGAEALPALAYTLMCLSLPESPRWLIAVRGDKEAGLSVLRRLDPSAPSGEVSRLADGIAAAGGTAGAESFWSRRHARPILLAFLIAFFNQLSGINAVLYFAPRIFQLTGLGEQAALLQSVGIGVTNLIFTYVGLAMIDRFGRRTLMFIGSAGYVISLGLCSWAFAAGWFQLVPACIFAFIAAHAVGQGAVIWVFISEIFPNRFRAMGQSFGSATHWVFAALLTLIFPKLVDSIAPAAVFLIFASMMVLQWLWVALCMPETRGVPLEQLGNEPQSRLQRANH